MKNSATQQIIRILKKLCSLDFSEKGQRKRCSLKRRVKKGCFPDKISGLCVQTHFANTKGQQFTFLKVAIQRHNWRYIKKAGSERLTDYTKILRLEVGLSSDQLKISFTHCWSTDSGQWYLINSVWRLGLGVGVLGVRVVYTRLSDSPHPQVFS